MNAAAFLLETGEPRRVAIEAVEGEITYGELRDAVARAAATWRSLGVDPGERVLVLAPDSIGWVVAYLGAIWAGAVAVGLNSRLFERELSVIVREAGARYVYCADESRELLDRCGAGPQRLAASELTSLLEHAAPADPVDRDDDDPAFWIYTSGTTGVPKAAIHAQRNVLAATDFVTQVLGRGGERERLYSSSKLFFAYALANSLYAGLRLGGTVVLDHEWPTAERVAEVVERRRPTIVFVVPTLYLKLLQAGLAPRLRGVASFVSAGEKLPARIRADWERATGVAPVDGYGTSETNFLMLVDDDGSGLLRPLPRTELRWREPLDSHGPNRVWLRHPSVALGYWERPAATEDSFAGGWFSPGDVFLDAGDGRLEIRGRQDDLLKISGQWVSLLDVEQTLAASCHGAVQELGALAVESADGLGSIALFAVAPPGGRAVAEGALRAAIDLLPKQRRPREVHWVDELPRTPTGKLQRSRLNELRPAELAGA